MVFGWGSSGQSPRPPPSSYSTSQHVQSFLSHNTFSRGTVKVPCDPPSQLYETSFSPSLNAQPYTLQIYLPPSFPTSPPIVTLTRPALATHAILNENMQCANLTSLGAWSQGGGGVSLVAVIEEIAGALIERAPNVIGSHAAPQPSPPPYPAAAPSPRPPSPAARPSRGDSDPVFHMPVPPVPSSFPDLADMSPSSLAHLLADDVALATYVRGLPCYRTMMDLEGSIVEGNGAAAKVNKSQVGGAKSESEKHRPPRPLRRLPQRYLHLTPEFFRLPRRRRRS